MGKCETFVRRRSPARQFSLLLFRETFARRSDASESAQLANFHLLFKLNFNVFFSRVSLTSEFEFRFYYQSHNETLAGNTMKPETYEDIVNEYTRLRKVHGVNQMKLITDQLMSTFSSYQLDYSTLYSLVNYEYRKEAKNWQNQVCLKENWGRILADWNSNEVRVPQLAEKYGLSGYTLLRSLVANQCQSMLSLTSLY